MCDYDPEPGASSVLLCVYWQGEKERKNVKEEAFCTAQTHYTISSSHSVKSHYLPGKHHASYF